MIPHLKSLLPKKPGSPAEARAAAERMPADEGMQYRREMLYQSIRESMLAMEVLSNQYKFKVINVDPQHQIFIALVEVSQGFQARWNGSNASFAQAEQRMATGALHRAGVTLQGVFWRVNETVDAFVPGARGDDSAPGSGRGARPREVPGDVSSARARLARHGPGAEQQAYLAATKRPTRADSPAPAVAPNPGAAPASDSPISGTQYGEL